MFGQSPDEYMSERYRSQPSQALAAINTISPRATSPARWKSCASWPWRVAACRSWPSAPSSTRPRSIACCRARAIHPERPDRHPGALDLGISIHALPPERPTPPRVSRKTRPSPDAWRARQGKRRAKYAPVQPSDRVHPTSPASPDRGRTEPALPVRGGALRGSAQRFGVTTFHPWRPWRSAPRGRLAGLRVLRLHGRDQRRAVALAWAAAASKARIAAGRVAHRFHGQQRALRVVAGDHGLGRAPRSAPASPASPGATGVWVSAIQTCRLPNTTAPPATVRSDGIQTKLRSGCAPSRPLISSLRPSSVRLLPASTSGTTVRAGASRPASSPSRPACRPRFP